MSPHKTRASGDAGPLLAAIEGDQRRADAARLVDIMHRATGEPPVLWGDSMVGFGSYHYKYDSGHEGDAFLAGFAPRKPEFSIYLMGIYFPESTDAARLLLERLGKHRMGKACLYVKKLADIDEKVLAQLVQLSIQKLREHFPR